MHTYIANCSSKLYHVATLSFVTKKNHYRQVQDRLPCFGLFELHVHLKYYKVLTMHG